MQASIVYDGQYSLGVPVDSWFHSCFSIDLMGHVKTLGS